MKKTVLILPQSDDDTLCITVRGRVTLDDHTHGLRKQLEERIKRVGYYNLVMFYAPDFAGWEADAAAQSFTSIYELGRYARRIAFVNPPDSKIFQTKISRPLLSGEVEIFRLEDLDNAISWAKAAEQPE